LKVKNFSTSSNHYLKFKKKKHSNIYFLRLKTKSHFLIGITFTLNAGEMLVGPAKALFMDEISTGLDSSTTFQIVRFMRQMVHIMEVTMIISLLQPAPSLMTLYYFQRVRLSTKALVRMFLNFLKM
jgi:ABC-type phosphonate transport system ATPase subunit